MLSSPRQSGRRASRHANLSLTDRHPVGLVARAIAAAKKRPKPCMQIRERLQPYIRPFAVAHGAPLEDSWRTSQIGYPARIAVGDVASVDCRSKNLESARFMTALLNARKLFTFSMNIENYP